MSASLFANECSKCGQRAPIVLRGLDSRCAACGAPRSVLAAPNTAFAGQPSRWGGLAASMAGTAVLVLGLSISLGVWLLLQSIWPAHWVGWAFAVPLASGSLLLGLPLLFGGNRLRRRGAEHRQAVQLAAVRARVQHQRGPISAQQVASELQLPEAEVDVLMTRLAQEAATAVTLDVDDQGRVVYDFEGEERRWRVLEEQDSAADEARDAAQEPGKRQRR